MLSPLVGAAPLERRLPVSVNIVTNQGSAELAFVVEHSAFMVIYHAASQQFLPLDIPFKVRSVSGQSVAYSVSLSQLGGQCDGRTPMLPTPLLDGSSIGLQQPHPFTGVEDAHVLTLQFPSLPQAAVAQQCEGFAGMVAELTV